MEEEHLFGGMLLLRLVVLSFFFPSARDFFPLKDEVRQSLSKAVKVCQHGKT